MPISTFMMLLSFFILTAGVGFGLPISVSLLFLFGVLLINLPRVRFVDRKAAILVFLASFFITVDLNSLHYALSLIPLAIMMYKSNAQKKQDTSSGLLLGMVLIGVVLNSQLFIFNMDAMNFRSGLGRDPNYDAFTMFVWIIVTRSFLHAQAVPVRYTLNFFLIFTALHTLVSTQSKMFFLMTVLFCCAEIFLQFRLSKSVKTTILLLQKYNFFLTLFVFGTVVALSFHIRESGFASSADAEVFTDRLANFIDEGGSGRATANINWLLHLLNGELGVFSRMSLTEMRELYPLYPHNSILFGFLYGGILHTLIIMLFISHVLKKIPANEFVKIFPPYLIATNVLHGLFSPVFLALCIFWIFGKSAFSR